MNEAGVSLFLTFLGMTAGTVGAFRLTVLRGRDRLGYAALAVWGIAIGALALAVQAGHLPAPGEGAGKGTIITSLVVAGLVIGFVIRRTRATRRGL